MVDEARAWLKQQHSYMAVAHAIGLSHGTICMFLIDRLPEWFAIKVAEKILRLKEELDEAFCGA